MKKVAVIYHPELGIYLGFLLDMPRFTALDCFGLQHAYPFTDVNDALDHIKVLLVALEGRGAALKVAEVEVEDTEKGPTAEELEKADLGDFLYQFKDSALWARPGGQA